MAKPSKVRKPVHHPALRYQDLPAFMARLRAKQGVTARALEFTILTAARTGEAIGATFDEFDLAGKVWVIPAKRMKAEKEHRMPLAPRAVAIVKEMAATRLNDYVFPGIKRGEPLSDATMLVLLRDLRHGVTVCRQSHTPFLKQVESFPDSDALFDHCNQFGFGFGPRRHICRSAWFLQPWHQLTGARRGCSPSTTRME